MEGVDDSETRDSRRIVALPSTGMTSRVQREAAVCCYSRMAVVFVESERRSCGRKKLWRDEVVTPRSRGTLFAKSGGIL